MYEIGFISLAIALTHLCLLAVSDIRYFSLFKTIRRILHTMFSKKLVKIRANKIIPLLISTGFLKYPLELKKIQLVYTEILFQFLT